MKVARKGEARAFLLAAIAHTGEDCVLWPFARTGNGYGVAFFDGCSRIVSRVVCAAAHGTVDDPEIEAAHSCGNRLCCNPSHLRWATAKENTADRLAHGTDQNGEKNHQAKLNPEMVKEILAKPHLSQRALGKIYRIDPSVICRIRRGQYWAGGAAQ